VSHQAVKSASGLFQAQISLDALETGIYTLQVRTGDGSILQKKFVKSE
jgi:hypothetical protein